MILLLRSDHSSGTDSGKVEGKKTRQRTTGKAQRQTMGMKSLMSAAHAAGYAMAAEDLTETAVPVMQARPVVVVHPSRPAIADALSAQGHLRSVWLREWLAGHWPGRAHA
jgi:hypothetical protein